MSFSIHPLDGRRYVGAFDMSYRNFEHLRLLVARALGLDVVAGSVRPPSGRYPFWRDAEGVPIYVGTHLDDPFMAFFASLDQVRSVGGMGGVKFFTHRLVGGIMNMRVCRQVAKFVGRIPPLAENDATWRARLAEYRHDLLACVNRRQPAFFH